ncbi:MAG: ABC transporter permease [Desulfobacteraceae bacterium]|jgi:NitT/TauT family transport system permease protein
MANKSKSVYGLLSIAVFLGLWEIVARLDLVPGRVFFPAFSEVMREFLLLLRSGLLVQNFSHTLVRVLVGFVTGSLCGLLAGTIMGWRDSVHRTLSPIISLLYPIPALGWLPLLMLLVGINEFLPISIIFICSFFPVCYNTATGVNNVNPGYVQAARTLGASERRILIKIILPLAIPTIMTGLRLESGMAWRVVIAAEMVAIPTGLGALMMRAESLVRMDMVIVCLMLLSVMCFSFEKCFAYVEAKLTSRWKEDAVNTASGYL